MSLKSLFGVTMALLTGLNVVCMARPVVIQEFTATWCPHCYGAGGALDRIEQEYSRDEVIIISFHDGDDFTTNFTYSVEDFYDNEYLPTALFNGLNPIVGGANVYSGESGITNVYSQYVAAISSEQERIKGQTPFEVKLTGSIVPGHVNVHITVTSQTGYPQDAVYAYFLITEDKIPVDASNGQTELNSVMRIYIERNKVILTEPGSVEFDVNYGEQFDYLNAGNLHPVVYLIDLDNKEVVGAAGEFTPEAAVGDWALYE